MAWKRSRVRIPSGPPKLLLPLSPGRPPFAVLKNVDRMVGVPTTPAQPILTVNQPAANAVVGLNPFQIAGQVTDRAGAEPIMIDSVTVQVDNGPLIKATLTRIPNKNLIQVSFHASAQISGGNDPHTVTIVATNDQGLHATKTVTVFTGAAFQVDAPAVLLDLLSLIPDRKSTRL